MLTLAGRYTIVIVTHNMAQARRVSDECIFMLLGEIIEHSRTRITSYNVCYTKLLRLAGDYSRHQRSTWRGAYAFSRGLLECWSNTLANYPPHRLA